MTGPQWHDLRTDIDATQVVYTLSSVTVPCGVSKDAPLNAMSVVLNFSTRKPPMWYRHGDKTPALFGTLAGDQIVAGIVATFTRVAAGEPGYPDPKDAARRWQFAVQPPPVDTP